MLPFLSLAGCSPKYLASLGRRHPDHTTPALGCNGRSFRPRNARPWPRGSAKRRQAADGRTWAALPELPLPSLPVWPVRQVGPRIFSTKGGIGSPSPTTHGDDASFEVTAGSP